MSRETRWYRVLVGTHIQDDPDLKQRDAQTGKMIPVDRAYTQGEVFPSTEDMVVKHGPEKFELLQNYVPPPRGQDVGSAPPSLVQRSGNPKSPTMAHAGDSLDAMTEQELRSFAAEEEIAVPPVATREQVIATIRGAQAVPHGTTQGAKPTAAAAPAVSF